ncbi:MAG TPA: TetR family transcriptional regulator [Solirubrobacteraceae bacterium]|nr:TetR family transcriptional regulator [Solirubrobacteraceae bacterium]
MSTDNPTAQTPVRIRRRDPEAHRAAILEAARRALAENGYARATIRDIARRAGVTHGLVMRHFGSKEQLMLAAFPEPPGLAEVSEGDPAQLPERLAAVFVRRMEEGSNEDPLLAVIRSAATGEQAAATLYDEMRARSGRLLERVLPDEALGVRGDLITSVLIGVAFERYVMRTGRLAAIGPDELTGHLAGIIRHILAPLLPAPSQDPHT